MLVIAQCSLRQRHGTAAFGLELFSCIPQNIISPGKVFAEEDLDCMDVKELYSRTSLLPQNINNFGVTLLAPTV